MFKLWLFLCSIIQHVNYLSAKPAKEFSLMFEGLPNILYKFYLNTTAYKIKKRNIYFQEKVSVLTFSILKRHLLTSLEISVCVCRTSVDVLGDERV